ncbi:30S ribosomal protein S4 [Candidatus Micrarchaeota archaeon]|nr:30S ribosomal protein S4 [Candidatus Micrarchaeota archaeon]MBU1940008.1 30S ribosomal protein S4 [Candidatus Micrarchaeota archaeon]
MAGSRRLKKQYEVPRKKWDKVRIAEEKELKATYGLKNKRELRKLETTLRKKRENARKMLALSTEERGGRDKQLMQNLDRTGLLKSNATLDDVLSLTVKELLERRLQTIVWRKNLANTTIQARQFITHGHIAVNGKKMNCPGYLVTRDDEGKIAYFGKPMVLKVEKKVEKKGAPVGGADAAAPAEAPAAEVKVDGPKI